MGMTVVDAGVVIAVLNTDDAHHVAARAALERARRRGDRLVLPASAYSEILVAPSRAGTAQIATVDAVVDGLPMTIEPIDRRVGAAAASLRASAGRGLRLPDALVLATAEVLDAERVLTTDRAIYRHGSRVELVGGVA